MVHGYGFRRHPPAVETRVASSCCHATFQHRTARARLLREGARTAKIKSPNVARVLTSGPSSGRLLSSWSTSRGGPGGVSAKTVAAGAARAVSFCCRPATVFARRTHWESFTAISNRRTSSSPRAPRALPHQGAGLRVVQVVIRRRAARWSPAGSPADPSDSMIAHRPTCLPNS